MSSSVSLVIPGRNCERTIDRCLSAVVAIQESCPDVLREILFVDDGSVDRTRELVEGHPVTLIPGSGQGPGGPQPWLEGCHIIIGLVCGFRLRGPSRGS